MYVPKRLYTYIYCENAINEKFLKSININGMNFELCTMEEYNDICNWGRACFYNFLLTLHSIYGKIS